MKVKQRLKINAAILTATALVILLVFSLGLYRINKANDLDKIAGDIVLNSFERVTLRNDYLHNDNERAKTQWFARHEVIGKILESASKNFQDPEDKKNIDELFKNHKSIIKIFSAIVENREKNKSTSDDAVISQEVEDRLISQLNIKVYEAVLHGRELLESSRSARSSAIKFAGGWTASVLIILIGAMIINLRTMSRAITDRFRRLRDGALVIGEGDLDHRIDIKGDDEFADLSKAFDAMTVRLQATVTEIKKAELALRESEERFRLMGDTIPYGAWMADAEGRNIYLSPLFLELVGMTFEQVMEFGWTGKMLPEDVEPTMRRWMECVRTGRDWEGEMRFPSPDGRWHTILSRGKPVHDAQGQIRAWVGINLDITNRKQAEEALNNAYADLELRVQERTKELKDAQRALQETNVTLEQRVAERTADLQAANASLRASRRATLNMMQDALAARQRAEEANTELRREVIERKKAEEEVLRLSEDMAARNVELESVNKELEAFIYSVSHDLRAPIRSMSGFAKIIVTDYTDKLDEQGHDYLNRILRSSAKATRLIDDLLYLSKISRHEIARTKVDMSKNAVSMVAELRESAPERDVEIDIKEGMTAFADPRLVEIIITNLFGNAWKFTARTDEARIEFGASEQDGRTVYYIKDNGVGFDPNYADKMFLPFHRLHSDSEFEGTGIGLAIVERIIHLHGGRIWAEGEVGKGATVYFTFGRG